MSKISSWNIILLNDYKRQTQHESVPQSQLLKNLRCKYLLEYKPQNLLFFDISSGNRLEHIDTATTKNVIGIDINESYLKENGKRFAEKIKQLVLMHTDISTTGRYFIKDNFV